MAFTTLYCIIGKVLAIVDGINVKHNVDNSNRKYIVTMTTTPPIANMADTLHVLNVHFVKGGKRCLMSFIFTSGILC